MIPISIDTVYVMEKETVHSWRENYRKIKIIKFIH